MFQGFDRRVANKIQTHENVAEHSLVCAGWGRGGFSLAWQCSANHSVRKNGICCSGSIMAWGGRQQKQSGWQEFISCHPLFYSHATYAINCHVACVYCHADLAARYVPMFYFTYSAKSVRCISPLRRSVSCIANAAGRQWRVWPPVAMLRYSRSSGR